MTRYSLLKALQKLVRTCYVNPDFNPSDRSTVVYGTLVKSDIVVIDGLIEERMIVIKSRHTISDDDVDVTFSVPLPIWEELKFLKL